MPGIGRPLVLPRTTYYDSSRDYSIDDSLNRVEYFSNAVMEDTYDAAVRSRGRDDALLRNANATIVSAEYQPSPRKSVVNRRVRASTAPPAPRPTPQQVHPVPYSSTKVAEEVISSTQSHPRPVVYCLPSPLNHRSSKATNISRPVVQSYGEAPWYTRTRLSSVPPVDLGGMDLPPRPRRKPAPIIKSEILATSALKASKPPPKIDILRRARARSMGPSSEPASYYENIYKKTMRKEPIIKKRIISPSPRPLASRSQVRAVSEPRYQDRASDYYFKIPEVKEKVVRRYIGSNQGRVGNTARPRPVSMMEHRKINVTKNGLRPKSQAAIIGSRLESEDGGKVRRPRSQFASNKLRELKIEDIERRYK